MRIKINLETAKELRLPQHHNHILQAWIYNLISDDTYRKFLHDVGYELEKRAFRLFTYSRLQGGLQIDRERHEFVFRDPVSIQISSPVDVLLEDIVNTGMSKQDMFLDRNRIAIHSIEILPTPKLEDVRGAYKIRTLSPIVVYSTFLHGEKKKTHFYGPTEPEFSELIQANLQKKAEVMQKQGLWRQEELQGDLTIKPLYSPTHKGETVVYYKDFFIRGHMGVFEVKADPAWVRLAHEVGMGSKNSQGFGMVEGVE